MSSPSLEVCEQRLNVGIRQGREVDSGNYNAAHRKALYDLVNLVTSPQLCPRSRPKAHAGGGWARTVSWRTEPIEAQGPPDPDFQIAPEKSFTPDQGPRSLGKKDSVISPKGRQGQPSFITITLIILWLEWRVYSAGPTTVSPRTMISPNPHRKL